MTHRPSPIFTRRSSGCGGAIHGLGASCGSGSGGGPSWGDEARQAPPSDVKIDLHSSRGDCGATPPRHGRRRRRRGRMHRRPGRGPSARSRQWRQHVQFASQSPSHEGLGCRASHLTIPQPFHDSLSPTGLVRADPVRLLRANPLLAGPSAWTRWAAASPQRAQAIVRPGIRTFMRYRDVDAVRNRLDRSSSPQVKFATTSGVRMTPRGRVSAANTCTPPGPQQ